MKERIKDIFFEMIPVILGFLIAIWVDDAKKKYDSNEQLTVMIEIARLETTENNNTLKKSLKSVSVNIDTLRKYKNNSTLTLKQVLDKTNGIEFPRLKRFAVKLLESLNSEHKIKNWNLISAMSENEDIISYGKEMYYRLSDLNLGSKDPSEKIKTLNSLNDLAYVENLLYRNMVGIDSVITTTSRK